MGILRIACVILVSAFLAASATTAADYAVGPIKVSAPWTRVVPDAAKVAAGFMTITNTGAEPDTLIGGTALISERLEVHEMTVTDGVMRMRELKPGLVIKPGETIMLKPGATHIMFMGLKQPLKQGAPVKGTLVFQKSGTVEINYVVEPFGTRVPGDGGQSMRPGKGSGSGSGSGAAKTY